MPKLKKRKIVVDNTPEVRDFSGKVYREINALSDPNDERNVADLDNPVLISDEAVQQAIDGAGWDDNDPGSGRAVLLDDGRELLNPVPMAPPVTYSQELSVNDLVERALARHYEAVADDKEAAETLEELLHFEEDDDLEPVSPWEVVDMVEEVPDIPKGDPVVIVDPPSGVGVTVVADGVPPSKAPEPKPPAA